MDLTSRLRIHRPSWTGGVAATFEKRYREASFDGADGVVVQPQLLCHDSENLPIS